MTKNTFSLLFLLCFLCSCQKKVIIEPLRVMDTIIVHNGDPKSVDKFVSYQVSGYRDNKSTNDQIKDFANRTIKAENISRYKTFTITFYSSVSSFNEIELRQHPDRYYNLNNTLYSFKWFEGKNQVSEKFKDGALIDPENKVIIKDLK